MRKPLGVRVHVIAPGYFGTNFLETSQLIRDAADPRYATGAYTTPEQGYTLIDGFHPARIASRQIGDPGKAAERRHGDGPRAGSDADLMDHKEWLRIPLGPDASDGIRSKLRWERLKTILTEVKRKR